MERIARVPYQEAKDESVNHWTMFTGRRFRKQIDNTAHARLLELDSEGIGSLLWCLDENGRLGEQYSTHTNDRLKTMYIIGQHILGEEKIRRVLTEASENSDVELTKKWVQHFLEDLGIRKYTLIDSETGPLGLETGLPKVPGGAAGYTHGFHIIRDNEKHYSYRKLDDLSMSILRFQDNGISNSLVYWSGKESKLRKLVEEVFNIPCVSFLIGLPRY